MFSFCPTCGDDSLIKIDFQLQKCNSCNSNWYQNPKTCSLAILTDAKKRIGLCLRAFEPRAGTYGLVGGFVEINETGEEALIREVKEELNIDINQENFYFLETSKDRYKYQTRNYYTLALVYVLELSQKQIQSIKVGDDVASLDWFEADKVPFPKIGFKAAINNIESYIKQVY